ncbi:hypothetical protein ACXHXG_20120 [Rhizobium sp. LEGMi198b]
MSSVKEHMLSNDGLKIYFGCRECDEPIEDQVENTAYGWTVDRASDGVGTTETTIACSECQTPYTIYVVADASEKRVYIPEFPDIPVQFHDDTFDHDDYDEFLAEYASYEPFEVYGQSVRELAESPACAPSHGTHCGVVRSSVSSRFA